MLSALKIRNYALLKEVTIEFGPGLNIMTGETGAGKSIIIGALNLAAGERGFTESIRTGEEQAVVEAVFELGAGTELKKAAAAILEEAGIELLDDRIIIKRELNRNGKGRIFINNSPATLSLLSRTGSLLIDIHGQHEHQSLLSRETHIGLVDGYAGVLKEKGEINLLYSLLSRLDAEIKELKEAEDSKQEKLDVLNFRINELAAAELSSDSEIEELTGRRMIMANTQEIKTAAMEAVMSLMPSSLDAEGKGAIDLLAAAEKQAEIIGRYDAKACGLYRDALKDAVVKASEAKDFFAAYMDKAEYDPAELASVEARIELLEGLLKKYKMRDLAGLKEFYMGLENEKRSIELNAGIIEEKEAEKARVLAEAAEKAAALSVRRQEKAKELGGKIVSELKGLGIMKGSFDVSITPLAPGAGFETEWKKKRITVGRDGIDSIEFMVSLNPGEDLKPLAKVASGGEISRIMLAIKNILSSIDMIPVMVFDEIDTGISGKIAGGAGEKLRAISERKQIICITHLPQIACFADTHFKVGKKTEAGKTETYIKALEEREAVEEVASLLSGEKITDVSIKAARELMQAARGKGG
ncbi:MAG TPA: DNA repair protein RecN [bacterium]|nr:DNA repair protein RecN [bacterium]